MLGNHLSKEADAFKTVDFVVANQPFSGKRCNTGLGVKAHGESTPYEDQMG